MSCYFCAHWSHLYLNEGLDSLLSPNNSKGVCTRYPAHIDTDGDHVCGELLIVTNSRFDIDDKLSRIAQERENYLTAIKTIDYERDKRITLEKINKELRAKLKQQRKV